MKVDIAIMTIREDEFGAVFDRLEEYLLEPFKGLSGRTYAIFSVPTVTNKTCKVALARSPEQGQDVAQFVASNILHDLDPQILLVVGIAGGVPQNEFTLGDVIISSRIHNFSVNAIKQGDVQDEFTFNVMGGIHPLVSDITAALPMYKKRLSGWNELESIGMERPAMELSWVEANRYGEEKWQKDVLASFKVHFGPFILPRSPLFKVGSIASSNTLMKDTKIPTRWRESARSILAVEMESAGALQAAQQMNKQYPVMAIRGISDIIGLERDERWTPYACQTAGAFTCAFIKAGIIEPQVDAPKPSSLSTHGSSSSTQGKGNTSISTNKAVQSQGPEPLDVFISYSVKDENFKEELETHLVMLRRTGVIRPWHSKQAEAGIEWREEVSDLIDRSQIILLLISPNFLKSDDLYEEEMGRAMKRQAAGDGVRVIPIILRSVDISETPFKELVSLPRDNRPVDKWGNRDEAWYKIVQEIRTVCDSLRGIKK